MSKSSLFLDILMALPLATSLSASDNVLVFSSSGLKRFQGFDKVITQSTVADGVSLNTITETGVYAIAGNNHEGVPVNNVSRSQLLVMQMNGNTTTQVLFHANTSVVYMRQLWDNNWRPWTKLANDASYVSPTVGGGKTLSFNHLRNYTERRWVA